MPSRPAIDAELLEGLARLLQSTGVTPAAQLKTFRRICGQLEQRPTPTYRQHLKNLPQIIGEWYRNPAYLDARGAPRPLRRSGRRSLMALAEQVLPDTDPAVALAALEHNRAIRPTRTGWVPIGKRIVYVDEDVRAHALEAIRSLLSTLEHNLSNRRGRFRLFECIASHPAVPASALKSFDARLRPQAMDFLQRAYADLQRLSRSSRVSRRRSRLGVSVFVFEDPPTTPHPPRPRRPTH